MLYLQPDVNISMPSLSRLAFFGFILIICACGGDSSRLDKNNNAPSVQTCDARKYKQSTGIALNKLNLASAHPLITDLEFLPGRNDVFYVTQQTGEISRIEANGSTYSSELLFDLREFYDVYYSPEGPGSCHECGLYDLAFHPDFESNGYIYLSFTEGGHDDQALHSHVSRFVLENDGQSVLLTADARPLREEIYSQQQPSWIHNNGKLRFGPDGYLYIGFGDGGVSQHAQDPSNVFGSILRLTAEGQPAPDNAVPQGLAEIFAYGFRNPWSWSFDKLTGDLWLGDVGWTRIEEINRVVNGGNYGWPCFEGLRENEVCSATENLISPLINYHHVEGRSVTGGYVYRGQALGDLYGFYIFGDFVSGTLWSLDTEALTSADYRQIASTNLQISAFAEDHDGELFVLDYFTGDIYQLAEPQIESETETLPRTLSRTGCINMADPTQPMDGVLAYEINESFWSDNAEKTRFMAIPEGEKIDIQNDGDFAFPAGTILIKNFFLDEKFIETRLLLKQADSGWSGYSYKWNAEQTEAFLLDTWLDEELAQQTWHYPASGECKACHTAAAGFALGLEVAQLNRERILNDGRQVNQLHLFSELELFSSDISVWMDTALVSSSDDSEDLDARARSYLHSNCAQCHRPGGTTQASLDFRYDTHLPQSNACGALPLHGNLELAAPFIVDPGFADNSILLQRISRRDEGQMPPLASQLIDIHAVQLIADWINSLEYCEAIVGPIEFSYALKNIDSSQYLLANNGQLTLLDTRDSPTANSEALWKLEAAVEKYYRITNIASPNSHLHTEQPGIHFGRAPVYWLSAMWEFVPDDELWLIRNRWRHDQFIGVLNGEVVIGAALENREAYLWDFEPVP